MSFISKYDSNKVESLLNDIEQEVEVSKNLQKELTTCKNQVRVSEILNSEEFTKTKLFQVRVKVFRTFTELLTVLPEKVTTEERSSQHLHRPAIDSNIFLIEVLVSTAFHNKLASNEWLVEFSIRAHEDADARKTGKCVTLRRNRPANSITAVLAFPRRRANDEIVTVTLTDPATWRSIDLARVETDISFKFTSVGEHETAPVGIDSEIVRINQTYADRDKMEAGPDGMGGTSALSEPLSNYRLCCALSGESFIAALVRNAYASLDPAQIVCNEGNRAAKIEINDQRVRLELDDGGGGGSGSGSLRMAAPGEELCQLKRYFTTASSCASLNDAAGSRKWLKRDFHHIQSVNVLKDAHTKLAEALRYNRIDLHTLLNVYDVYQRFIDGCPL